ncbi:hypothetical protein Ciccas_012217 [Cichlidogyrus casuarinus]|uniref:Uncharacterized protein n=1 Tax=Cichlidogyrus casuarinus TaxID=1844966 RepID=A0ABD2PRB7_9PLAT
MQHGIFKLMRTAPPQIYSVLAQKIQQSDLCWGNIKEAVGQVTEFGWPQPVQVLAVEATQPGPSNQVPPSRSVCIDYLRLKHLDVTLQNRGSNDNGIRLIARLLSFTVFGMPR